MFYRKRKRKLALSLGASVGRRQSLVAEGSMEAVDCCLVGGSQTRREELRRPPVTTANICLSSAIIIIVIASSSLIISAGEQVNAAKLDQERLRNETRAATIASANNYYTTNTNTASKRASNSHVAAANRRRGDKEDKRSTIHGSVEQYERRTAAAATTTIRDDNSTNDDGIAKEELALAGKSRFRRSLDSTRIVAVSGQWLELKCPLASELLAVANSGAPSSQPDHAILWRKDGLKLSQLNPRQRVNSINGSLTILGAQQRLDEGSYECQLVHLAKEEEPLKAHRFELKLIVQPRISPFEFPANAQVGMKLVLTCSVLEGQQPISFVWLKDNQIINPAIELHQQQQQPSIGQLQQQQLPAGSGSGQANSLSQLHQQQLADKFALGQAGGPFGLAGSQKGSSEYVLLAPSGADGGSQSQTSPEQPAAADNNSNSKDQSPSSGQLLPLLSDSNVRIRQADDYSILSIDKLELKHSGRYTCSVQNEAARASHSSQLLINAPPTFTMEPKDGDLVSGQSTVIGCAASGQPRPTISWLRARESGAKHQWDYVPVYDSLRYSSLPNGSLAITNVTQREQGYYLCSAKNGFGPEMTKLIKITVHEPAKFSSKYKTMEVKIEERANMICVASGELPINIEWLDKEGNLIEKTDKRFIIDNDPYDMKSDRDLVNATVSRLILARSGRADSGHYTCQAANKHGSDKMVTNLLVQDVPDKVTDLKVTNATSSTISIRWQLAFSGNSPITSYLVQYQSDDPLDDLLISSSSTLAAANQRLAASTSSSTINPLGATAAPDSKNSLPLASQQANSPFWVPLDALNIASALENADEAIDRTLVELTVEQSSTHLVVKDLSPYCVYRLRLAGINKIGLGEFSDWIRAKTEEAPPSGVALKILATATGPNSVKLAWMPPDRRSWNGQLVGFNIGYRPVDSSFELNKTVEWSLPSLQSIMFANTIDGRPQNGANKKLLAAQSVHNQLRQTISTSPSAGKQADKAMDQSQANSTESSGSGSQYLLRQHLRELLALQQQELVAHLTNLQRSTTYLVWIQAVNNRGFGPKSHAISVKTLDDVPPSAPAIKIQSTSPNSITVAWSMMSNLVSSANQYSLFYRRVPWLQAGKQQLQPQLNSSLPAQDLLLLNPSVSDGASASSQLFEPGPFIERTISSQQLLMSGNLFFNSQQQPMDGGQQQEHQQLTQEMAKPSFLHQQPQHYQQFVYTLDQLECGSVYELYMTTRNSVGKSEPSSVVTTRTIGEPPQAPANKNNLFSKIGINDVSLNLASWSTGGCPLTHITLKYKQAPIPIAAASSSQPNLSPNLSSNLQQQGVSWPVTTSAPASLLASINGQLLASAPTTTGALNEPAQASNLYVLKNLLPSTCYDLEIIAHNAAGHTLAQYEFVTASANGSRSGYSRREGVFRLDQRGLPIGQGGDSSSSSLDAARNLLVDSQREGFSGFGVTGNHQTGNQLIPFVLMLLCFVCLIISFSFCYYRLRDSWKSQQQQQRRSSDDTGASSHYQAPTSSPGSIGGKSSMWRINNNNHNHQTLKARQRALVGALDSDQDSPVHYCMRDPNSGQLMGAAMASSSRKGQPTNLFTQSVSMKDFNLMLAPNGASSSAQTAAAVAAATLNYKNYRTSAARAPNHVEAMKGGTLRGRLVSDSYADGPPAQSYNAAANVSIGGQNNQICSMQYAAACKQNKVGEQTGYGDIPGAQGGRTLLSGQQSDTSFTNGFDTHQHCGYPDQQVQETSWSNQYGQQQQFTGKHNTITYAIPSAHVYSSDQNQAGSNAYEVNSQQLEASYRPQDHGDGYGSSSIDACIQQLMSQEYQQQQYAMIMNHQQKVDNQQVTNNNRCLYGHNDHNAANYGSQTGVLQSKLTMAANCAGGGQSVIESSSSSSGIDIGAHLDCGSSATGTSNSNGSHNGYQSTQANCETDFNHNTNNNAIKEHFQQTAIPAEVANQSTDVDLKQV